MTSPVAGPRTDRAPPSSGSTRLMLRRRGYRAHRGPAMRPLDGSPKEPSRWEFIGLSARSPGIESPLPITGLVNPEIAPQSAFRDERFGGVGAVLRRISGID